ncbi:hypothetical protein BGZ68_000861 [Mortierella alpina]|nr:hypothetical protein BGZ68_000861 [Mortierella alpina]
MDASRMTYKQSTTPTSGKVSTVPDRQHEIKKGDEYRDRGDFDKAKARYEKAAKFYPAEAQDRLVILPLYKASKAFMEDSDGRVMSVRWRARAHNVKEKVKQALRSPSPIPSQQQSFFPRPSLSTQSTVASLAISNSPSTSMSISTCVATSTSTSQSIMDTRLSVASETVVNDVGVVSDVHSLTAAYKTADDKERGIIEEKIYNIIKEFGQHQVTFDTVQELVVLVDIQDRDIFLHIVTEILRALKDMPLLSSTALQGLAVILDLFPDEINMNSVQGAFVEILTSLQNRLHGTRTVNNDLQLVPLLSALNALLDAMVRRQVFGLEREAVYNDLRALLTELTPHSNVMVCFQALYAKQALAIIGNDESLPMSVFRRGKLAFVLAGNISNMVAKFELASAESAYQNIKDIFDNSIRDRWYQGLIYVDYLVGQHSWCQLEDFVLHSRFQSDICFQLGVVLRLEQIAAVQVEVAIRDGAIKLLIALEASSLPLVPDMVQGALHRLESLKNSTGGLKGDMANPQKYQDLRPVWDPAWLAAPKGILFKSVQNRDRHDATVDNLPAQLDAIKQAVQSRDATVPKPSLEDVQSALQAYYKRDLAILRVSGEKLSLETCFVNLAIVEAPAQRKKDKQDLKKQAAVFHRIPSSEAIKQVNMEAPIPLEEIFYKRKLRNGVDDIPKTILVQGRAGVGKTTLCKKLVHAHQTGLWRDRFDTVLWLPLRQIKAFRTYTLEGLFRKKFFTQGLDHEGAALAHELAASAQGGRVLFVLDGLDEIAKDTRGDDDIPLRQFLEILLMQQHVIVTSRPSGLDKSLLPPSIDLELETVGFSQQNVSDFVSKVLTPQAAETVQRFIRQTPLIQGLVNIPVQLDVICYSWDSLPTEDFEITMTGLYQLMG